jgi:DNA-binding NtrC family response regulator
MRCYPWPGNIRELENVLESLLALHPDAEVCAHDLPPHIRGTRSMATPSGMTIEIETDGLAFGDVERVFETEMIVRALEKANYVQSRAATMLGISRRILKYKMDKLGIAQTRG